MIPKYTSSYLQNRIDEVNPDPVRSGPRCHTYSVTHTLWTRDRPRREDLYVYWTPHSLATVIHTPAGFEFSIPASERPQTRSLDRAANGIYCLGFEPAIIFRWKVQLWSSSLCNYLHNPMSSPLLGTFVCFSGLFSNTAKIVIDRHL